MSGQTKFTQGHALLVGVGSDDLPNTVQDATGLADILRDVERCAYPVDQVTVLTKAEATREGVLAKLDELANAIHKDSTLIFYFSGHGYAVDAGIMKEYFLIPHGHDDDDLSNTAISRSDLMTKLNAIGAQKQLILFDCCHAAGLDDLAAKSMSTGIKVAKSPISQATIDELAQGNGRVVISSSKADELSYAGKPYSQFTQALLEGFAGEGASKQDGLVRVGDLASHASRMVPQYTRNRQNPAINFSKADNFAVAYYAAGGETRKGLPKSMVRQPDPVLDTTPTGALTINQSGTGNTQVVGNNNTTVAERGVNVRGDVSGNIVTGNDSRIVHAKEYNEGGEHNLFKQDGQVVYGDQHNQAGNLSTDGGFMNLGRINMGGGDFVGRDKHVGGDEVHGDKISGDKVGGHKTEVGNITGSTGVAIGPGAQARVNTHNGGNVDQIIAALQPILTAAQNAPADQRADAVETANALKDELSKVNEAQDGKVGDLVGKLGNLIPSAATAFSTAFGQPVLAALVGPVTKHFLEKLGIDMS